MIFCFEDFELDAAQRELRQGDALRAVEPQVFDLLILLVSNSGKLVTKDTIYETIWDGRIVSEAALSSRVFSARDALGDSGRAQRLIKTVHGHGFRFVGEVSNPQTQDTGSSLASQELRPLLPRRPSIAVLPFDNMSTAPEHSFLGDGICEDILTALSKIPELFVIARNSSFQYKGRAVDIRTVGQELGVAYVLEGSVRASGDRVRITAQLIRADIGGHLWAERYDRQINDIFALQDEMTKEIVSALLGRLITTEDQARIWNGHTAHFEAWQLLARATQLVVTMDHAKMNEAVTLLERAIDLDPRYLTAHTVLGNAWFHFAINGWADDTAEAVQRVSKHAQKALEIESGDPLAFALLAFVKLVTGDKDDALALAEKAQRLGPNALSSLTMVAFIYAFLERYEGALEAIRKAVRLSPVSKTTLSSTACFIYTATQRFHDALISASELLREDGTSINGLVTSVISHHELGDLESAASAAAVIQDHHPQFAIESYLAGLFLTHHESSKRSRSALLAMGLPA